MPAERVVETRIVPRPATEPPPFARQGSAPRGDHAEAPRPRIDVVIGRIDVEVAQPAAPPAAPVQRERPRGFDDYARLRSYLER